MQAASSVRPHVQNSGLYLNQVSHTKQHLIYFPALKMEAIYTSKMSVNFYWITHHTPGDSILHLLSSFEVSNGRSSMVPVGKTAVPL
jgi:hypothetical protein